MIKKHIEMKRTLFLLSLLMVSFCGSVFAQAAQAPVVITQDQSELTVFKGYKKSLVTALNEGNLKMANPHRIKLLSAMDREVAQGLAVAAPNTDVARQKAIADEIRTWDLTTLAGIDAAKTKLSLIDEFEQAMVKLMPKID
jgi:hypothetical protein